MDVNYELFKIFYTVAISGSISKGAERLRISQPAVTMSIKTLEEELGGILFIRTPKGVILTSEGEILFNNIKEGITFFNTGIDKFRDLKNLEVGRLTIGSTTSISEYFLIKYLRTYQNRYPNIEINIVNDLTKNLIKDLRNGSIDIVISSYAEIDDYDVRIVKIGELHDIVVSGNKNAVFDDKNLILQKYPSITRGNIDKHFNFKPKMEVVSHSLLTNLVVNGFGQGVVTREFIEDRLDLDLFEVKTDFVIPTRNLGYIIKKDSAPSFATIKFIDILKGDK